tara:strand:+ start:818 stop:1045 length:228 start_codon:yes stop_codon:yes gene_type:complete
MIIPINPDTEYQSLENALLEVIVGFLYESDWTQIPNNPLTPEKSVEWATWRQQLRDFPETWIPSNEADLPDPPMP